MVIIQPGAFPFNREGVFGPKLEASRSEYMIKKVPQNKQTYIHTLYFNSNNQSSSIELKSSRKKNSSIN